MPFPGAPTFYTDANKLGMACFKSEKKISKVIQTPYTSVEKPEFYATLCMALLDFPKLFNVSTDSQYAESCSA